MERDVRLSASSHYGLTDLSSHHKSLEKGNKARKMNKIYEAAVSDIRQKMKQDGDPERRKQAR